MGDHTAPDDSWLVQGAGDPADIARHYDDWAEQYDTDLDSWSYRAPTVVAATVMGHSPEAESLLDVGCGTGMVGRQLRAAGFSGHLTGVDLSAASLQVAGASGAYDEVRQVDLTEPLPFADDTFAALSCVGVLTYLPDVAAIWREFARVVTPGGPIAFTQREDLWEPRECARVIESLAKEGVWTPRQVEGPAPYLPEAGGELGGLGCYYVLAVAGVG